MRAMHRARSAPRACAIRARRPRISLKPTFRAARSGPLVSEIAKVIHPRVCAAAPMDRAAASVLGFDDLRTCTCPACWAEVVELPDTKLLPRADRAALSMATAKGLGVPRHDFRATVVAPRAADQR